MQLNNIRQITIAVDQLLNSQTLGVPAEQRLGFVTGCLATALAISIPLPPAPVAEALPVYFNAQFANQVASDASKINEHLLVDMSMIVDQVRKAWIKRYEMVYNPTRVLALMLGDTEYVSGGTVVSAFLELLKE